MLRNEIQKITGLTRKAIEYYQEKGLIRPQRLENGYRDYDDEDLEVLNKISVYRKLGLKIEEIEEILHSGIDALSAVLRRKEYAMEMAGRKRRVLDMIIQGVDNQTIAEQLTLIENELTIYDRLTMAFPGYIGQMLFVAYQPFLDEPIKEGKEHYFQQYICFLDNLPAFELEDNEYRYIEKLSSTWSLDLLKEVNFNKIQAVNNPEEWLLENQEFITDYQTFKGSSDYLNSPLNKIQEKFVNFLQDNNYYEHAIPLLRSFSQSYDNYYKKLIQANKKFLEMNLDQ
ncbi:MerR family transcriptional regulator [Facklamia miroungae]|uniref:MerR HTH family regulatory protein n=1 Tax=Facklamia miroungae TaxID=120956 RepID=A0A1G7QC74_9LACT|nr:MerR family transcriptional regulator [Facklamia miroungae]NKZ28896.1 MerR family transcriptional regulator [Facklamia miroungae]SDF96113.1 MerR HTH family regulatory protein [Facklamia miroungae]